MPYRYSRNDGATQYTFTPDIENKKWLEHASKKNRRPMSAEINILIDQAREADKTFKS